MKEGTCAAGPYTPGMQSMESAEKARLGRGSPGAAPERSWSLPAVSADARLRCAGACIAVALACGMLLSPNLWLTRPQGAPLTESFPQVAPHPALEVLAPPGPLDWLLYAGTLVLCGLAAVHPRRLVFATLFGACLLLALPDLMRWQPWFYLYAGMVGTLAFVPRSPLGRHTRGRVARPGALQVLRLMVGCVYFYSGLNKLNAAFFEERLQGFLAGMPASISEGPVADLMTYSAPGLEIAAGLGLLLGGYRVRHAAVALAASTNLFVLAALIPAGANLVVWPWNLAMIALVGVLFAGRDGKAAPVRFKSLRRAPGLLAGYLYAVVVIVLFAAAPAAGVAGYWPSYLSFALYSQNTPEASVEMPSPGGRTTVTSMTYETLNVPAYPSLGVYEAVGERSCEAGLEAHGGSQGSVLVVRHRPDLLSGHRTSLRYSCEELREIP